MHLLRVLVPVKYVIAHLALQGETLGDSVRQLTLTQKPLPAGLLRLLQGRIESAQVCFTLSLDAFREFAEETMGLFGGCSVNGSSVAACSKQMHTQLTQRQHVLKVVHQLKKVIPHSITYKGVVAQQSALQGTCTEQLH